MSKHNLSAHYLRFWENNLWEWTCNLVSVNPALDWQFSVCHGIWVHPYGNIALRYLWHIWKITQRIIVLRICLHHFNLSSRWFNIQCEAENRGARPSPTSHHLKLLITDAPNCPPGVINDDTGDHWLQSMLKKKETWEEVMFYTAVRSCEQSIACFIMQTCLNVRSLIAKFREGWTFTEERFTGLFEME